MAMNLDDLKERFKGDFQKTRERFEESALYNSLNDRYQNLNPLSQKLVLIGIALLVTLAALSLPFGHLQGSGENVAQFETTRSLIRDLLHVQKEINETPEIPVPPPAEQVRSQVESSLTAAGLLPEQMKGVTVQAPIQNQIVKNTQNQGVVEASLASLNVRQIVDLGYQLQTISPSVKLKDVVVTAAPKQPGYFDVLYRLLVLKVTPEELPPPEPPPKKKGGKK